MAAPDESVTKAVFDITKPGITNQEVMKEYVTWADTYDEDMLKFSGFNPPRLVAEEIMSLYPNNNDIYILDAAAGTGGGGEQLTKRGFNNLDALDASPEMLAKAKEKNIYKRLICDFLGHNRLDIQDDTYDAVVTTGSFCSGHVNGDCLDEMIRIIKPGGHFVLAMGEKYLTITPEYHNLEQQMQDLVTAGKWAWLTRRNVDYIPGCYPGLMFVFQIL